MDPERLRGPDAALEIGRLAYGHLGLSDGLSYAPEISPAKEAIARARIAPAVPADEPLLVLYDSTFLGTAMRGFAITQRRFCFRSALGAPRAIEWEELRSSAVTVRGGLGIGGDSLRVSSSMVEDTARLLDEIARRLALREVTPYRQAATLDPTEGADAWTDAVARVAWRHLGALAGARYHPFIPPARLARARAALGSKLPAHETPAVVYEDAFRAPQTFVITRERLAWCTGATYESPRRCEAFLWAKLRQGDIVADDSAVRVRDSALPWLRAIDARPGLVGAMAALFHELADGAKSQQLR
jgi:hypothetical protein